MMFYTTEARNSAIEKIHEISKTVSNIPGNYLNFDDACKLHQFLGLLVDQIEKEEKETSKAYYIEFTDGSEEYFCDETSMYKRLYTNTDKKVFGYGKNN